MSNLIKLTALLDSDYLSKFIIENTAENIADLILAETETNKQAVEEALVKINAIKLLADHIDKFLRNNVPFEEKTVLGCKIEFMYTAGSYSYAEDPIYMELEKKIKHRKKQLQYAADNFLSELKDENGNLVPRVNKTSSGGKIIKLSFPK